MTTRFATLIGPLVELAETLAGLALEVIQIGYRLRMWLSVVALVFTFLIGSAYVLIGGLRINPLSSNYRVTVHLA